MPALVHLKYILCKQLSLQMRREGWFLATLGYPDQVFVTHHLEVVGRLISMWEHEQWWLWDSYAT